jgi:hypothetical protein
MEASVQLLRGNISEMLGDEGEGDEIGRCSLVERDSSALTLNSASNHFVAAGTLAA